MAIRSSVAIAGSLAGLMTLGACGHPVGSLQAVRPSGTSQARSAGNAPIGRSVLVSFDRNQDGVLEQSELAESWLGSDFGAIDTDHNGKITQTELDRFFQSQGGQSAGATGATEGLSGGLLGGGAAAAVLALGLAGYLTYTGLKGSKDFMLPGKETFAKPPSEYGMAFDEVGFQSHDGLKLVGWYVAADVPTTKGIVLFHGHGSNKDTAFKKYGVMLHDHFNLFIYDQRYCGESQGPYSTLGYLEDKDAVLAVDQLRLRGNTSIGLMGESMGAAVAIDTGAVVPDVRGVWADCAFDSLYDACEPRAAARHYPLPGLVADSVIKMVGLKSHCDVVSADPIKWVAKIAPRPLYVVHGQKDDETTPENGEKLFKAAGEPKTMWRTPNAKHAESWSQYPDEYRERIRTFFDDAL
jgi:fermentation-respiration switch protein FrsA (DUF1100 family)